MKKVVLLLLLIVLFWNITALAVDPPVGLAPLAPQRTLDWQKDEFVGFIHFNLDTFLGRESAGTESPDLFQPGADYDPSQWVKAFKDAGARLVILTAKHHGGFCLWPSAYTDFDVEATSWQNGQGDVVKDFTDACHAQGMKVGIYYNTATKYGDLWKNGDPAYNDFMANQLTELLTNYGEVHEVWFDTPIPPPGLTIDHQRLRDIIDLHQPNAVMFGARYYCWVSDIHWCGNEHGEMYAGYNWATVDRQDLVDGKFLGNGQINGDSWNPGEADVSIRPGWFYKSNQDTSVKTVAKLMDIWFKSVGRNGVLNLNIPPMASGAMHPLDVQRIKDLRASLDATFGLDFARNATVTVEDHRGAGFEGDHIVDGDPNTYWAATDGVTAATIEIDWGSDQEFDTISLQEHIDLGQRINGFEVDVYNTGTGAWDLVTAHPTVGQRKILSINPVTSSKIRVRILDSRACPTLHTIGVHKQTLIGDTPVILPDPDSNLLSGVAATASVEVSGFEGEKATDGDLNTEWQTPSSTATAMLEADMDGHYDFNKVVLYAGSTGLNIDDFKVEYFDGYTWFEAHTGKNPYSGQVIEFPAVRGSRVRVSILSTHGIDAISVTEWELYYDPPLKTIPPVGFSLMQVSSEDASNPGTHAVDGDNDTHWQTNASDTFPHEIQVDMGRELHIGGFTQLPRQIGGSITQGVKDYELYLSLNGTDWGTPVSTGTWSYANRDMQRVTFTETLARYFKFVALSDTENTDTTSVGEVTMLLGLSSTDTVAPSAVNGLVATGGDWVVNLDWDDNAESDLLTYTVYRTETSGSGYQLLAEGIVASEYADQTVISGKTYYYLATATDLSRNESVNSSEVFATPYGTAAPGIWYGTASGNINTTTPNPQTSITTTLSETEDSIAGGVTEIYTGQIYDADGQISFTEHIDDKARLYIDGVLVLSNDAWGSRTSTGNLNLAPGWHIFELRISNGGGRGGPSGTPGFGYDSDGGSNWSHPEDPGDGSLFRHAISGGADVTPPVAPTGLTATAGNTTVDLDWGDNSESDLASYTVKRSTASGSGYIDVATGLTSSDYSDTNLINGIIYYYVVTAIDVAGNESANSSEAPATPTSTASPVLNRTTFDGSEPETDGNATGFRDVGTAEFDTVNGWTWATSDDGGSHSGSLFAGIGHNIGDQEIRVGSELGSGRFSFGWGNGSNANSQTALAQAFTLSGLGDVTVTYDLSNSAGGMYLYIDDGSGSYSSQVHTMTNGTGQTYTFTPTGTSIRIAVVGNDGADSNGNLGFIEVGQVRLPGDLNGNGFVNLIDFSLFSKNWQDTACGDCNGADLDGDNDVDLDDLRTLVENWLGP